MHNSLKEQILESVDIVDVIGERVALTRKGREYVGLCPFHDDHRPSMSVSPQKQIFKCWSCLAGGDVIKFVQLSQRVEFREALSILAQRAGIEMRGSQPSRGSSEHRDRMLQTLAWARTHFQRNLNETASGKRAREYALGRGMSAETIERFGIGYAADSWNDLLSRATRAGIAQETLELSGLVAAKEGGRAYDRFRNRLIFPISDATGRCVAFGGRALGDDPAKYLNSPETPLFSKSRILYGLDMARRSITTEREAVVVEGYVDAVLLSQAGIGNVVATLGTALTDFHVKLLGKLSDRIIACFDSDEAGLRAADRAVETALRHRVEVAVAVVPDGKDPADYVTGHGAEALKSLLQSAIPALEFYWHRTLQAYRDRGRQGQRDAVDAFLSFVARVTLAGGIDPLEQGLLVGRLGELLSLPPATVFDLIAKAKARIPRMAGATTPAASEQSEYDARLRGIPVGLVAAMEELFGVALDSPERFQMLESALAAGSRHCEPWERLYRILDDLRGESGSFTKAEVAEVCEDNVVWELVNRACSRIPEGGTGEELCRLACERVSSEIELMRMETLRGQLRGEERNEQERAAAFRSLRDAARRHHSPLCASQRWNVSR